MKCRIYKVKAGDREGVLLSELEVTSNLQVMNVEDILDFGEVSYKVVDKRFRLEDGELILVYKVY